MRYIKEDGLMDEMELGSAWNRRDAVAGWATSDGASARSWTRQNAVAGGTKDENASARTWVRRNAVTGEMIENPLKPMPRPTPVQSLQQVSYHLGKRAFEKLTYRPCASSHHRTAAWVQSAAEHSHGAKLSGTVDENDDRNGVYANSNISVYADGIPDAVKQLPFSKVMMTHPRLFRLVVDQMQNDRDYFQWSDSAQDLASPASSIGNEKVIPILEPSVSSEGNQDSLVPNGLRLRSPNGVVFRNPWMTVPGTEKYNPPVAQFDAESPCQVYPQGPLYEIKKENGACRDLSQYWLV